MPVPRPGKDETQSAFMGRCMRFMVTDNNSKPENGKRPRKQMVAICFSQWENSHSSGKDSKEKPHDGQNETH